MIATPLVNMIYMIPVCSVVCLQSVSSMPWMVGSWITKSSCRLITWALTRTQLDSDALQTTCCHLRLRSPTAAAGSILAPAPHNSSSSSSSCCCCWSELSYVTRLPMPDAYSSRQPPSSSSMRNTDRNTYQDKPFPPPTTCWFDSKIGLSQGCHWCLQQRQQHPRSHLLWSIQFTLCFKSILLKAE